MIQIPVYQPSLSERETEYVVDCLKSTWISSKGSYISRFERAFADYTGAGCAASCSNGTVALHLALLALGIGEGDEVIVPTLTYIACANAIRYTGAVPVFADSVQDTWQIDAEDVARRITPRTKAIMAVHLYGQACDMDALCRVAADHRLFLIEDCAEAFGTKYKGRHVGTFGDIATFSFFGNKTITTGEGGMVTTNDQTLHERTMHLKGQGLAAHREYWHDVVGYNYRMTNICAAIGLAQIERADELLAKKRRVAQWYAAKLEGLPLKLHAESSDTVHSYWMCSVLLDSAAARDPLRRALLDAGIETRPVFFPIHTMPMYERPFQRLRVAESIAWRGINLPSWPDLGEENVTKICSAIARFFAETERKPRS